jgi:hypothetical protein
MKRRKDSDREQELKPDPLFADEQFRWLVSLAGYRIERVRYSTQLRGPQLEGAVLGDMIPAGAETATEFAPMQEPALFEQFASIPPSVGDGAVAFANRYGLLGCRSVTHLPPGKKTGPTFSELLDDWEREAAEMRRALDLWHWIEADDRRALKSVIRFDHNHIGYYQLSPTHLRHSALPNSLPIYPGDVAMAGRFFVQRWANEKLKDHAAAFLVRLHATQEIVFRIRPKNLLGCIWLQFARVIAGELRYMICKVCQRRLPISSEESGVRADREFCSAACRQKDHRRKVREAKSLKEQGRSIAQIAKHFGSTRETICNWLTKEK